VLFRFSPACDTSTLWMRASGRISDDARASLGEKLGGSLVGPARGAGDNSPDYDVLYATFGSGSREPPNPNGLLVTPDWHVAE
jgi:hypothetical protein